MLSSRPRGFSLIELMAVVAIAGVLIALVAPSFTRMIQMQRLRGTNAQLVTDMQFARSEAVARNTVMRVAFYSTPSVGCYTIYTSPTRTTRCDCTRGVGNACIAPMVEVKTAQIDKRSGVNLEVTPGQFDFAFGFDPTTGGIISIPTDFGPSPVEAFRIDTYLDSERKLQTWVERSGRPTVCRPTGSTMSEDACRVLP